MKQKTEYIKDNEHKLRQIILLGAAALAVLCGSVVFVGAAAGWFSGSSAPLPAIEKVTLSSEYINNSGIKEITKDKYQKLVEEKKSFILLSHLPDCQAKIMQYTKDYAAEHNILINDINWAAFREIAKENGVNFAPTVLVVSNGKIISFLRSDSDADIAKYNEYNDFKNWLDSLIKY